MIAKKGARKAVLDHLRTKKSITSREAFELYGVTRLSALVFDFRKAGYEIETIPTDGFNRFGEHCVFAKYLYLGVKGGN